MGRMYFQNRHHHVIFFSKKKLLPTVWSHLPTFYKPTSVTVHLQVNQIRQPAKNIIRKSSDIVRGQITTES